MNGRLNWSAIVAGAALVVMTSSLTEAQWSIGAPGKREAPAGKNRYAMLVFANPVPGHEADFNDWYTTTHMGDLVQLDGWTGAQRFRIVTNVTPLPTKEGYRHGFLIIWDQEETSAPIAAKRMNDSIAGGKSRRGAAFNYTPGAGGGGTYKVAGPRISSGKPPVLPAQDDYKTPRLSRYVLMDFANPLPGKDAEFTAARTQEIKDVLGLTGWMAAQQFEFDAVPGRTPGKPRYLTLWEVEAVSAQAANDVLANAMKEGKVKKVPSDEMTAERVYWEPITPYITKEDFVR